MYYFFFSYSRGDNTEYLRTFYKDLDEAVREKVGGADLSFFDQSGNEPGDFWEEKLEQALGRARVFVAVATADYVKKPYCGKEWAAFQERIARYHHGEKLPETPSLAIPILWVPPKEEVTPFPDAIKKRHFHVDNPGSIPNTKGVAYLTKIRDYKKEYLDLLSRLADRIVDLAHAHKAMDSYADAPSWPGLTRRGWHRARKSGGRRAGAEEGRATARPLRLWRPGPSRGEAGRAQRARRLRRQRRAGVAAVPSGGQADRRLGAADRRLGRDRHVVWIDRHARKILEWEATSPAA